MLDIPSQALHDQLGAHWWPNRGLGQTPPSDPVIYRLYEGVMVYGEPIKVRKCDDKVWNVGLNHAQGDHQ